MTDRLTEELNGVFKKLNTYFSEYYSVQASTTKTTTVTTIHHVHHNSLFTPYPMFYALPSSGHTTIINNNLNNSNEKTLIKKKDKEDEEDIQSTVGGIALIGIVSALGTYVVSTDEYTNFTNSEITADIKSIINTARLLGNPDIMYKILVLEKSFEKWSSILVDRTYTKRNTKISGTLSGLTIGSGLFFGSMTAMTGGAFGVIASTCYFTWDYYSKCKKIDDEKELFEKLFVDINDTIVKIEEIQSNKNSLDQPVNICWPIPPPIYPYPQQHTFAKLDLSNYQPPQQHTFAKLDLSNYPPPQQIYTQQNNQLVYPILNLSNNTYSPQNDSQLYVNPIPINYVSSQYNNDSIYTNSPQSSNTYPQQNHDSIYTNSPSSTYVQTLSNDNNSLPKLDLSGYQPQPFIQHNLNPSVYQQNSYTNFINENYGEKYPMEDS